MGHTRFVAYNNRGLEFACSGSMPLVRGAWLDVCVVGDFLACGDVLHIDRYTPYLESQIRIMPSIGHINNGLEYEDLDMYGYLYVYIYVYIHRPRDMRMKRPCVYIYFCF